MGHDGALPGFLGKNPKKYKPPHIANGVVLIFAFLISLVFYFTKTDWELGFALTADLSGITIEITYIYTSIAAIIYFRKRMGAEYDVFAHLIVPVIAVICMDHSYHHRVAF